MSDIDKDKRKKTFLRLSFQYLGPKKDKKPNKIYVCPYTSKWSLGQILIYQPVIFIRENQNGFVILNFLCIHKSVRNNNQNVSHLCQASSRTI